jgi:hypothetical protein
MEPISRVVAKRAARGTSRKKTLFTDLLLVKSLNIIL